MKPSLFPTVKRFIIEPASLAAYIFLLLCSIPDDTTHATPDANLTISPSSALSAAQSSKTPAVKTSTSLVSEAPRAQYFLIKRAYAEMWPVFEDQVVDDPFDLESCFFAAESFDLSETDPIAPLAELAFRVIRLRKNLTRSGYPKSVWGSLLLQFEEEQLVHSIEEMGKPYPVTESGEIDVDQTPTNRHKELFLLRIEMALRSYRQRRAPKLPKIYSDGGCGSGGIGVNIRTEPSNGRVVFIPVFFYRLCKAQRIDPDDLNQCDRWREPAEGLLTEVSGDYFYRASWPGGVVRRGHLSFTNLEDGQTVTIHKP